VTAVTDCRRKSTQSRFSSRAPLFAVPWKGRIKWATDWVYHRDRDRRAGNDVLAKTRGMSAPAAPVSFSERWAPVDEALQSGAFVVKDTAAP